MSLACERKTNDRSEEVQMTRKYDQPVTPATILSISMQSSPA